MTTPLDILAQQEARDANLVDRGSCAVSAIRRAAYVVECRTDGQEADAAQEELDELLSDLARARAAIKLLVEQRDNLCRCCEPTGAGDELRIEQDIADDNAALLAILRGET